MKILILPINIASQPAITAEALNKIDGIEAKCITNAIHSIHTIGPNTVYVPHPKWFPRKKLVQWLYHKISYKRKIGKWIKWADVLHYVWGPAFVDGADLDLGVKLRKPTFIEWFGGDIRNYKYL